MKITIEDIPDTCATEVIAAVVESVHRHAPAKLASHQPVVSWSSEWTPERALLFLRSVPLMARRIVAGAALGGGWVDTGGLRGPDGSASLRGQATAISKAIARGARQGHWSDNLPVPVAPVYDPENQSYQRTLGYSMPSEYLGSFQTAVENLTSEEREGL